MSRPSAESTTACRACGTRSTRSSSSQPRSRGRLVVVHHSGRPSQSRSGCLRGAGAVGGSSGTGGARRSRASRCGLRRPLGAGRDASSAAPSRRARLAGGVCRRISSGERGAGRGLGGEHGRACRGGGRGAAGSAPSASAPPSAEAALSRRAAARSVGPCRVRAARRRPGRAWPAGDRGVGAGRAGGSLVGVVGDQLRRDQHDRGHAAVRRGAQLTRMPCRAASRATTNRPSRALSAGSKSGGVGQPRWPRRAPRRSCPGRGPRSRRRSRGHQLADDSTRVCGGENEVAFSISSASRWMTSPTARPTTRDLGQRPDG